MTNSSKLIPAFSLFRFIYGLIWFNLDRFQSTINLPHETLATCFERQVCLASFVHCRSCFSDPWQLKNSFRVLSEYKICDDKALNPLKKEK